MASIVFSTAGSFRAEKGRAAKLRHALDAGGEVIVEAPDGSRVPAGELSGLLAAALAQLAAGGEVMLLNSDTELSPAEAGELLGISRQFVDRLIDMGRLPARRLPGSRHRRLRSRDVMAFAAEREKRTAVIARGVNAVVDAGAEY